MRGLSPVAGAALLLVATGCSEPEAMVLPVFSDAPAFSFADNGRNAAVPLSGGEEVPARATRARGNATFQLSADGQSLHYQLIVANIENVFMAHIHNGPAGANAGIVVWLHPSTAVGVPDPLGGGRVDGVIASGTITAGDLTGALAGQPLSALTALMASGGAYVNVHTNDGVAPTNTGPGDFPGGEIRGQIR